jgi:hypothetical protein
LTSSQSFSLSDKSAPLERRYAKQQDILAVMGLFWLGLLTRLPFTEKILYHWDSINFAFSLQRFDVAAGQPQVPGYILFVYLARLFNLLLGNPERTLVSISVLSSGMAVAALYGLGTAMFDRRVGMLAALFLASSPLFWFYGEVALPHTLDALVVILAVWMFYNILRGQFELIIPAAIWLGIAGGLRPQTELFLMPLAALAAWRIGWRRSLLAGLVLGIVNLAWLIPLMWLSGGISRYLEILSGYSASFNTTTSIFTGGLSGLTRNLRKLSMYTLYGWSTALLPALLAGVTALRSLRKLEIRSLKDLRLWVISLWVLPGLIYYVFVHMGQQGLVFVFLPALFLLSALGFFALAKWIKPRNEWLAAGALLLVNALIFIAAPAFPLGGNSLKLLTADTIRQHDAHYLSLLKEVPNRFSPSSTILLSSEWRFPEYYLPEYTFATYSLGARWEVDEGQPEIKNETWLNASRLGLHPDSEGYFYLVIFDTDLIPFNQSSNRQELLNLPGGEHLAYIRFTSQEQVHLDSQSFGIVSMQSALP